MNYIISTLGCKVNQYETSAMEILLDRRGHRPAAPGEQAELVIVNTCAVTAESGRKSRQTVRRLKAENPGAVIAVCGCYSQLSPGDAAELGANVIFGTGDHAIIAYGNFLQNIINFLIQSFCIFILVRAVNNFFHKKEEQEQIEVKSSETALLEEIRDLLAQTKKVE